MSAADLTIRLVPDLRAAFAAPRRVWAFIAVMAIVSATVWTAALELYGNPHFGGPAVPWWVLALAFYLTELFVVHLQFRKEMHTLSLTEIGLTIGLLLGSPAGLLVGQVLGTFVALAVNRRQPLTKLVFNVAEVPLGSGVALLIFRSLASASMPRPELWALILLAAAVAHTIGIGLVTAVIAVAEVRFDVQQLKRTLSISLLGAVAAASLGIAAVALLVVHPLDAVLLFLPVVACVAAFRGYWVQREQLEHVEFLYESMRATQGAPEFGLAVGQLLVAARRLLRAEYAEILLLAPGSEPPIRSVSGPAGELLMHPEERFDSEDAEAVAVIEAADGATLVPRRHKGHVLAGLLRRRELEDAIVGPLRGEDRVIGLLIVGNRSGDVGGFDSVDSDLFETFSGHASILLENGRLEHSLAQVTELKEQLKHQAYHDALTGLPNRVQLLEAAEWQLLNGGEAAVLYVDLDRFKTVNDTWGHAVGDELLVEFASRLRSATRARDVPARLGGDEFAVLLPEADAEAAQAVARRVLDATGGTYQLSCGEVTCHASIGIAVGDGAVDVADELVRNADIAMYSVKRSEQAYALYEVGLHETLRAQRQLGLELEVAIARGDIDVHFQPLVDLTDGRIEGFEALARWRHPVHGLLPAAAFLPAAEEAGLMVELGQLVLERALETLVSWPTELGLWLNLAPTELAHEQLVEELAAALMRQGVNPERLTIEITESSVGHGDETLRAMDSLRELGVHLTIDDFGTGYSSLSRLANFPIESLKIPKPFVDRLIDDNPDETFVDAILRLGDSLGLAAVGEGIEHPVQAERLRQLGCRFGQGYLFGHPMPAAEVDALLAKQYAASPAA